MRGGYHQFTVDRRGVRADPRRRAGQADLARLLAMLSAGTRARLTRSSATRWARRTARRSSSRWASPSRKDFSTFPYLGNMGTVSLPMTAALAEDRAFLRTRRSGGASWGSAAGSIA